MGERSGAPSGFSPASIVISNPPVAVQLPQPDVSANRDAPQLEAETLGAESALARIDEALGLSDQVEHRCSLPFLHRLRGEILLKRDPPDPAPAEAAFRTAIALAKELGARSLGLQAALALAKLNQSTGRPA